MYSGMADVAALTGDQPYLRAIDDIWKDVVEKENLHHRRYRRHQQRRSLRPGMTCLI